MTETENQSTGPRTLEGKLRSSQNAVKHGLFATKSLLLPGESQEEFDRLLYRYNREYLPKGPTEEDLVRRLVETEWRRRRIPALEAGSIEKSLESGDVESKFLNTYSIYEQRFNRSFQSTLKTLAEIQDRRKKETAVHFRIAAMLLQHNKISNTPWNPADDGFVFSPALLDRQFAFAHRIQEAQKNWPKLVSGEELDVFIAKDAIDAM